MVGAVGRGPDKTPGLVFTYRGVAHTTTRLFGAAAGQPPFLEVRFAFYAANTTDQAITLLGARLDNPVVGGEVPDEPVKGTVRTGPIEPKDQISGVTKYASSAVVQPGEDAHRIICIFVAQAPENRDPRETIRGTVVITDQLEREHIAGAV